jgi:hypothetical protein
MNGSVVLSAVLQVFQVQLDVKRSRKFPVTVPLHNLRPLLGITDTEELAERVSKALQVRFHLSYSLLATFTARSFTGLHLRQHGPSYSCCHCCCQYFWHLLLLLLLCCCTGSSCEAQAMALWVVAAAATSSKHQLLQGRQVNCACQPAP